MSEVILHKTKIVLKLPKQFFIQLTEIGNFSSSYDIILMPLKIFYKIKKIS